MNTENHAVVRACSYYNLNSIGMREGYDGLINNQLSKLDARSVKYIINRGGTFLKSARSDEFRTKEGRMKAYQTIQENAIDALIIIGGDGSFRDASVFYEE